jgi:aminomethyltransferase
VREGCGLFDVSHMGEFMVRGKDAVAFTNYVTSNDVAALDAGQVQYSTILNDGGTIEDDCLVYRYVDRVMMVVNASNREKDFEHISRFTAPFEVTLEDISDDVALLALQGPNAEKILSRLTPTKLADIKYYHFDEGEVAGMPTVISRTGYTGEDGFELYFRPEYASRMWDALTENTGVTPAGLGARDTLRLEMGFALYGNDIDSTTTPLEANLTWLVKLKKGEFVGRDALFAQKERGLERKLSGFVMREKAFPRHGYPVVHNGTQHGLVRSGTVSPTLGIAIGTCYLPPDVAKEGTPIEIEIRRKRVPAEVVKMPFYKRKGALG